MLAVIGILSAQLARAQQGQLQPALDAMAANPADPTLALRYAQLAARAGDARSAIAALERVLRIDPSLDNIRLELASLHLASGSPDLAAVYAREALSNPRIPPDVAEQARARLEQAEAGSARQTFRVNLFAGLRYDTNANEATSLGTIPLFVPALQDFVTVTSPQTGRSDWSSVLSARAEHRLDLGLQREGTWETNAGVFDQRFARIARDYDLDIATVDSGPRIAAAEFGASTLLLRPHVTASWLGYGGSTYAWLYGVGMTAELRLSQRLSAELTWIGRFGNYESSDFRPRGRDFTGFENNVTASIGYLVGSATRLGAFATAYDADAREDYLSRKGLGAGLLASTVMSIGTTTLGLGGRVGVREVRYGAPDPLINPDVRRRDTRREAGAQLILPLTRGLSLVAEYEWFDQHSKYAFYRYDNHAVTVGLRLNY